MTSVMLFSDVIDDVIHLMVKNMTGRWRHLANTKIIQQREYVEFQLSEPVQRSFVRHLLTCLGTGSFSRL